MVEHYVEAVAVQVRVLLRPQIDDYVIYYFILVNDCNCSVTP